MDRAARVAGARRMNIDVAGGGAHPFQNWSEQRITPSDRFNELHRKYGYLAKTFTVFGQHIHIGVANGDDAMYLTHGFARFVPHFIALSAASPFYQGVDTAFDSSRSNVVRAFPLAGTAPPVRALSLGPPRPRRWSAGPISSLTTTGSSRPASSAASRTFTGTSGPSRSTGRSESASATRRWRWSLRRCSAAM